MLPGGNGRDDVIILVDHISEIHSSSGCRIIGSADAASFSSGPDPIPLTRFDDGGLLYAPLLVTAHLVEVVEHRHIVDIILPHIWGLWREGSISDGFIGGNGESSTASMYPPTS